MKKDKLLATLKIKGQDYSIRATIHAQKRMVERRIDEYVVSGNILALGYERLMGYRNTDKEFAIVDKIKNVAIIAAMRRNTVIVITVIDKEDIWIKDGTAIFNLI